MEDECLFLNAPLPPCVLQGPAGAKGDKGERVSQTTHTHSLQKIPFLDLFCLIISYCIVLYILYIWIKAVWSLVHFTVISFFGKNSFPVFSHDLISSK